MKLNSAELSSQRKNLALLAIIRAISIVLQVIAIGAAITAFGLVLPLGLLAAVIVAEAAVNGLTLYRLRRCRQTEFPLRQWELLAQLLFDVFALAALLYLTGGGLNPFTGLFIVPVILAATLLPQRHTWFLVGLSIVAYVVIALMPVAGDHSHHMMGAGSAFDIHRYGMLLGFVVSAILITVFVSRIAANLAERDAQLYKVKQLAEASRQINALGMLAAGAAHDLGTPLNSMSLIESELRALSVNNSDVSALLDMHSRQLERAKRSLGDLMSVTGESRAENASQQCINQYFEQVCERWRGANQTVQLSCTSELANDSCAAIDSLFEKAIVNLLDNAAKVSPQAVQVCWRYDDGALQISVADKGPGISDAVINSLQEPAGLSLQQFGFGLFWVNAFAIRMGGNLAFKRPGCGGTEVILSLPMVLEHV